MQVPYQYGGDIFAKINFKTQYEIILAVIQQSGEYSILPLFSYYTDGGVQDGDKQYFIDKVFDSNPKALYSSAKDKNIHIKAICSYELLSKYDIPDIKKLHIQGTGKNLGEGTYKIPYEKQLIKLDPHGSQGFNVIKYVDIPRNFSDYTCPLKCFALFISMEEIDPMHPIVTLFDDINDYEKMNELGFSSIDAHQEEGSTIVEFTQNPHDMELALRKKKGDKCKLNGVYPLLWGSLTQSYSNYVTLTQMVGFRHLLLKLINANNDEEDNNIDCQNFLFTGYSLKLEYGNEE